MRTRSVDGPVGAGVDGVDGAQADEAAAALLLHHVLGRALAGEEVALEPDRHEALPGLLGDLEQRRGLGADRRGVGYDGVVDQDVDAAGAGELVDGALDGRHRREVGDDGDARGARLVDCARPVKPASRMSGVGWGGERGALRVTTSWVASSSITSTMPTAAQPARARQSATPRPIPFRAPVTSALLPLRARDGCRVARRQRGDGWGPRTQARWRRSGC